MSSSRLKPKKPAKRCIFCGGNNLSGEHLWPDWAAPLFADIPATGVATGYGDGKHGQRMELAVRRRQGRLTALKIYAVCETCNSGWMSRMETAVKPVLTALSKSETMALDANQQNIIAHWITLKMMVAEHTRRDQAIFPPTARVAFKEHGVIPDQLQIWLFRCGDGTWRSAYYRHALSAEIVHVSQIANVAPLADRPKNAKSIALGFNDLFIYANFTVQPRLKLNLEAGMFGRRLWPPTGADLLWPPIHKVTEDAATQIAQTLERLPPFGFGMF